MRRKCAGKEKQRIASNDTNVIQNGIDMQGFQAGTVECGIFWDSVKREVSANSLDRQSCLKLGKAIVSAWKSSHKTDKENRREDRREAIENEIMEDLFYCSVLAKRPYSQRFTWISDAFLTVKLTKRLRATLFRCTMPVIWRNLEVPNEDVRQAASALILKFFPLISDDEFIREDYITRQQNAMAAMLMDSCVPVRVAAAKKVPEHLNICWDMFPREMTKLLLETLVDQLSLDSVPEVRAAVYEGIGHLMPNPAALTATQRSIEILAKRGANDKSERVRLAAFKMLNKLYGHRFIKPTDNISLRDCFYRLDFETSCHVEHEIVRLLYYPMCPRIVKGIDPLERFKRVYFISKHSRLASLHFHRLVYFLGLMSVEEAVQHIRFLILGVKMGLRKCRGVENVVVDDTMNISGASTFLSEQQVNVETEEKLNILKHVLDSAIVLWMTIRYTLFHREYAQENEGVTKVMSNILQELENFSSTILKDSALIIASYLPKDKIGHWFHQIKRKLTTEETSHFCFPYYVEALSAWNMTDLITIIEKGLMRLRNAVIAAADPDCSTPRRRRRHNSGDPNLPSAKAAALSPRAKRARMSEEPAEMRRPLELIRMLLASPQPSLNLQHAFSVHLEGFFESLCMIRTKFGDLLLNRGWETKFDPITLISAYETFTIVALITKQLEPPRRNSLGEEVGVIEEELTLPLPDRVLYNEMKWFARILQEQDPSLPIIEMFLRCSSLHLRAHALSAVVLNEMGSMLNEIKHRLETAYDAGSANLALRKCVDHLVEALECCDEPADEVLSIMERKIQPLREYFQENERSESTLLAQEGNEGGDESNVYGEENNDTDEC